MYEDLCLYIDGQFLKGEGRKEQDVVNPATDEVIGKLPHASKADLDRALESAKAAAAGREAAVVVTRLSAVHFVHPPLSRATLLCP